MPITVAKVKFLKKYNMYEPVEKTPEQKSQSVANTISQRQSSNAPTSRFVDNRPEAIQMRRLRELAKDSQQNAKLRELHNLAAANPVVQKKRNEKQSFGFVDDRPERITQRKLQEVCHNYASQQQQPIQKKENNTGLPDNLKSGIENLSGYSMDDVKVHYDTEKPAQLKAHAYAQGTDIHLASGQEKHLPHEAWHVVQQKQGRVKPTMQMKEKVNINDDAGLEKEADVMGVKAIQFKQNDPIRATLLSTPFLSPTLQRRKIKSEFHGELQTEQLDRDEIIAIYKQLKRGNGNKETIEELEAAMRNNEFKGDPIDPTLLSEWDDPKDYLDEEPQERIDLSTLSAPIVKGLGDDEFSLQDQIMDDLNRLIEDEGEVTMKKDVFRLCTVEIEEFKEGMTYLSLKEPALKVPSGLASGFRFVRDNEKLIEAIKKHVFTILSTSGQLKYIEKNKLLNKKWRIIVDVDFYYNRPPDAVGFHKDTVGRSMFVNLNFNNKSEIIGPEFILNPKPIKKHDEHIVDKLPQPFMDDLMKERRRLSQPQEIQSTRIPAKGMVSFVDEMLHHTTPYRDHRGVSNEQLDTFLRSGQQGDLYRRVRTAYLFDTLVNKVSRALVSIDYLREIELTDEQIKFLCPDGSSSSSQNMKSKVDGTEPYNQMKELVQNNPLIVELVKLTRSKTNYQKDELMRAGLHENDVNELFNTTKKPDMDRVTLAGCEDLCHLDLKDKSFPLVNDEQPRLKRQMSEDLLTGNLPPNTKNKRQFFRTWVQAIKREEVSYA